MTRLCLLAFSLGIVLLTLFASAAEAQVSVYGMAGLSRYGFSYQGDSYSFKDDTASFGGGAFYNFPIHSRLTAGIDGRVLYGPASYGAPRRTSPSASALFPRVFACGRISRFGGGVVSSVIDPGVTPQRITNGAAEFLGGLDIRLTDSVDLRAVEYGAAAAPL